MKRKIYTRLLEWKTRSQGKTAIMIDGARRTGKSYIATEFAKNEYRSYILIDFYKTTDEIKDLFINYLDDLDTFFIRISTYYNIKLFERETLFIFDEIQFFPRARAAIKYLVADGRYDYIETGSLVSIKKNVKDILIPSEEEHIKLNPMDFEEFLWACGNTTLFPYIKSCFETNQQMGPALHRKAMNLFRQYIIVGGMPQAVAEYSSTGDFEAVDKLKRGILELYRNDIAKHSGRSRLKAGRIFDAIPSELSHNDKRFKLSSLDKEAKGREYEEAFTWLEQAGIINFCYNTTEPNIGLRMNMENSFKKCYLADTGLLISLAFDENGLVAQEVYKKLLFGKLEVNQGMIFENVVSQILVSTNHNLYFYINSNRNDKDLRMEVDFLITKSKITNRHNILPIEVKSSVRYSLSSLNKYMQHFSQYTGMAYVLHTLDLKVEDGITYLPVYMAYCL